MRSVRVAISFGVGLLAAIAGPAARADLTVEGVFNQREFRGPSSLYGSASDWIVFGATNVVPNGDAGTTGTFSQINSITNQTESGSMVFTPFSAFPNNFGPPAVFAYDPGLSGSWSLAFTNKGQTIQVDTPAIGTAPPPAPPLGLGMSNTNSLTPTLSWHYPSNSTATSASVTIYDGYDIIHVDPLGNTAQSTYAVPSVLSSGKSLQYDHPYTFSIELNDNRNDGSYRARGFTFVDFVLNQGTTPGNLYLPQTVTNDNSPFGLYYQFVGVPVQAGVPVNLDPGVALGYEFDIGAGDPLIKTVTLPTGVGDGKYDLYVLEGGVWKLLAHDVQGGGVFTFAGNGVDRFRVGGIEPEAGLDPANPTAFVTALTFNGDGTFNGQMIPLTDPVPEPQTYALIATGLALIAAATRRRRSQLGPATVSA